MIVTRYLSAAGVALFMMGVAAGYGLNGSAAADAYAMAATTPEAVLGQNDRTPEQSIMVAVDAMAPGAYWAPRTGDGLN
jgi:hypothetical protein